MYLRVYNVVRLNSKLRKTFTNTTEGTDHEAMGVGHFDEHGRIFATSGFDNKVAVTHAPAEYMGVHSRGRGAEFTNDVHKCMQTYARRKQPKIGVPSKSYS